MRVLCVGNMYPPHHLGGYELVWQEAVDHLRERGHSVRVLTTDYLDPSAGAPTSDDDPEVYRELRWYWRDHRFPRIGLRARIELERANARTFERHLAEHTPDVVSWWAMGGMSLALIEQARRHGMPAVAFVNDDWLLYAPKTDAWMRFAANHRFRTRALERATGIPARFDPGASLTSVVFASESVRDRALKQWPLPNTEVAYGGIDPAFLNSQPAAAWEGRLLYVGRIDPRKGIDTAIEALEHLPSSTCLKIVGGGDREHLDALRALAERLGVAERVDWAGQLPRHDVAAAYAATDAVVFPVRWEEPWGLVPLEAMASGRPVIATGTGGSSEYLRDLANCLLFPAGDAAALAACVRRLAGDQRLRHTLTTAGRETAAAHTHDAFNARVEAVLGEAPAAQGARLTGRSEFERR